jgi:hypothetical protein
MQLFLPVTCNVLESVMQDDTDRAILSLPSIPPQHAKANKDRAKTAALL